MSDDLVERFVEYTGENRSQLTVKCDGRPALYKKRRKYIIENLQDKWLAFCAEMWGRVYDSFYAAFDGSGKKLLFNSCWTRDPFEAYLRFGFDYKRCLCDKAYALTVEEVSATAPIFGDEDRGGFALSDRDKPDYHYEAYLMQQSIKAYLPNVKQITLTPIRDTCEQWDLMRHSPTEQERAIFRRNNNYVHNGEKFVNCSAGPLYCLSDSMRKSDWDYLARKESASSPEQIERPLGYLAVFSDNSVRAEAEYYLKTNRYSSTAVKNRLLSAGLCIDGAVRAEHACLTDNPLLIINPEFYSESERAALDGKLTDAAIIGEKNPFSQKSEKEIKCGYLRVWLYGKAAGSADLFATENIKAVKSNFKPTPYLRQYGMWGMPLKYDELPKKFFAALAETLNKAAGLPVVVSKNGKCVLTTFKLVGNRYRMLISNNAYHYYIAKIKLQFAPTSPKSILKYDGYTVATDGNCFYDRIPPRGMDIVEFEAESKGECK